MKEITTKYLNYIIYWAILFIPFSMSIAIAPMNVFSGLMIAAFLVKKILKREQIFLKNALAAPLFLFFLATCLSVFNSVALKDSFRGGVLRLLQYILVFFIIVEEVKDIRQVRRIMFSAIAGLILASLDGIWQVSTGADFIRGYLPMLSLGFARATASFKDPNTSGVYLSAVAPLLFGLTLYYTKGVKRLAFIALSLIALMGIALTYSRPTLLATFVVLLFLASVKKDKVLLTLLLIFTLISPFILPKPVKDWAKQVNYNPARFMCNDDRIAIYRNSLYMIKAHPVIGVGANTFMKNYKKYERLPNYRNVVTSDFLYAHNNFLHMAGEIGLVGLGIFVWMLFVFFKQSANIYRRLEDRYLKVVSLSLIVSAIAFLVNGLTESSLYSARVAMIFWYIMGFSFSLYKFTDAKKE